MSLVLPSHRVPLRWLTALAVLGILAACGGGGPVAPAASGDGLGSAPLQTTAIVTADVDGDGRGDVLEVPIDAGADAPTRVWRGRTDGAFEGADERGSFPGLDAIRDDLQRRPDHDILADEGVHRTGAFPYAVLHLERGDDADDDAPPSIDTLLPERGQVGALVGIRGTGLATRDTTTRVQFDDLDARVLLALPGFVLAVVPDRAPLGAVDVVVARGDERSAAATFTVVEQPTPQLDSVRPDPLVPGVLAVLRGSDLGTPADDVRVSFGGVDATRVLALGRAVFAEVPAGAASGLVIVTVDGVASNGVDAEIASELDAPTLTAITPATASPGSLVRIEGEDLFVIGQAPRVDFGTERAQIFGIERGALVAIVPADADGDVTVTVGGRTSDPLAFTTVARSTPVITSLSPDSGEAGDAIDILGTDLHDLAGLGDGASPAAIATRLPRVTFGDARAWFVFPIPGGLRAIVPFRADAGAVDVTVRVGDDSSDPATFTVR